ncbi:MAG TPA: S53 family peptidase [Sphingomicrobium sp.]|nr:S53 family peptidase [Sphingomicrobium sp.]
MSPARWGLAALACAMAAFAAAPASAQAVQVERSGNTYHVAVCPHGNPFGTARCFAHVVTDARGNPLNGKINPSATAAPSGYGPADLRSAYNITSSGTTTTVAIVDAYGYPNAESDLATYRSKFGIPACTTANGCFKKVDQNGGTAYPRTNTGWDQEQALDLDMVSAMCPNCHILLVEASTSSLSNLGTAVNTAANTAGVTVISNSYGGSESGTTSFAGAYNHPGKAITVSTGDSGYGVQFPASAPTVIAVGGTHLVRSSGGRGWTETAWSGGGSGCSTVYAKPGFQTDPLCTKRMEADVSAVADPNTGVAVFGPAQSGKSTWLVFGGTSVAAPLIGGIYGVTGNTPTGAATIYANKSQLNDVTSGTNGSCGGTYFCTAGVGYDGPTGNGTPNGTGPF